MLLFTYNMLCRNNEDLVPSVSLVSQFRTFDELLISVRSSYHSLVCMLILVCNESDVYFISYLYVFDY